MAGPPKTAPRRRRKKAITCADCFFDQNLLCALDKKEPCPTFRPASGEGLTPPRQLSFLFPPTKPRPRLVPFKPPEYYAGYECEEDACEGMQPAAQAAT